jgi:hypothetical protein
MADQFSLDRAVGFLDELIHVLQNISTKKGFDPAHKELAWVLKAWVKIAILASHPEVARTGPAYWQMKRDPSPANGSRTKHLTQSLDNWKGMIEKHKQTHGDFFTRAETAVRDLVWEYRKRLSGKSLQDFESMLMQLAGKSKEQFLKERIFQGEQHI